MITINIHEAKTQLYQLLSQLEKDGEPKTKSTIKKITGKI